MSVSSVSPKSPVSGFDNKTATLIPSAAIIQGQITALEKRIAAEKLSKSDDAKLRVSRLDQYNFQLQQLNEQLAKVQGGAK
jgi:hypothetical protein